MMLFALGVVVGGSAAWLVASWLFAHYTRGMEEVLRDRDAARALCRELRTKGKDDA